MLDVAAILRPWWDRFRADHGDLELFDAHTHIGAADPDGARQTPEQLLAVLAEGQVRVTDASGTVHKVDAEDGFLSVDHDRVEIVARNAKLA